jgi:hypothetical protein
MSSSMNMLTINPVSIMPTINPVSIIPTMIAGASGRPLPPGTN